VRSETIGISVNTIRDRFQVLLREHDRIVFKVAAMYCRDVEDRKDLAQEICVQAWRSFSSYDDTRPFSTWLYRVALNVAISSMRRFSLRKKFIAEMPEGFMDIADDRAGPHEPDERLQALRAFIGHLDPLNRALMLLYLEDRSYREIGEALGISETNVATKINRLKQRIRAGIAPPSA
jgi:RNA polymerase sigma factor (sigma-70 family)